MSGNSIGKAFTITCFGESHGKLIGVTIDGCPAGLELGVEDVQRDLDRRKPGVGPYVSPRRERDEAELVSGIFKGKTTGAPITIIIYNRDVDSRPYEEIRYTPRPGHADYPAEVRYGGYQDYRGGGRFSGRITGAYVAAGAIAKKLLKTVGVEVLAHTVQIGKVKLCKEVSYEEIRRETYRNPVRCVDPETAERMLEEIRAAVRDGDSVGGIVEGIALGVPAGWGFPIFDSIDADLAKMAFNIPGVKGVEFGSGFKAASMRGSENNDQYTIKDGKIVTETNNSGGVLGGLSNGMPIKMRVAFKPTASIPRGQKTVDLRKLREIELRLRGRYDPCIVPRAVPVVEACMALVLADHAIRIGAIPQVLS
ncbi:chorismate synthase [Candidatus Bathyarchaeota archaeon]|nr:MAG: chorismate synthase [Candidatus Bathyarchaeota archaeon]